MKNDIVDFSLVQSNNYHARKGKEIEEIWKMEMWKKGRMRESNETKYWINNVDKYT